ncbi:uncharacterized protein BO66DRAFT_474271 [Aspergillus aculeatinus CBS 121060]|uniref:Uncharacterized protein n=1 Tax=Aspergillus aculeatinus CBS 121060 TaxID=1448322 RepID=A0ACD1GYB0_9EURO|nr:hypothetical protein BO66DRAFT_474271 [Aspergillus aculeatinus CBS 121060]RAH66322.1 hypothetical protein BO66DRAFT_474271 [Aspergillus aculeatinus CBS 121060]
MCTMRRGKGQSTGRLNTGRMGWFPTNLDSDSDGWSFDIVGLLAVIGGSATDKHLPAITASPFSPIPRLLPAPETLLRTDRAHRLPAVKDVKVIGIQSGNFVTELNYFTNLLHDDVTSLPPFTVKVYCIGHRDPRVTHNDKDHGHVRLEGQETPPLRPIKIRSLSWLNVVTFLSVVISAGLLIAGGVLGDGVALVALTAMCCSTSAATLSAQWSPRVSLRTARNEVPPADVALVTRAGAFVIVHCADEDVCRELYTGMDDCQYRFSGFRHRMLLASSTLLLMAAVILFSNCGWKMQIAVGSAYVILNVLYWLLALLVEPRDIWDLTRYDVCEVPLDHFPVKNFTQALWLAIHHAGDTRWVRRGDVAPLTEAWDQWLAEALQNVKNIEWDAVGCKDRLMKAVVAQGQQSKEVRARAIPIVE